MLTAFFYAITVLLAYLFARMVFFRLLALLCRCAQLLCRFLMFLFSFSGARARRARLYLPPAGNEPRPERKHNPVLKALFPPDADLFR
ncbi:MAG: hypothetical protein IT163_15965 [Bryobacterales bacterium]|nr:hypothetical protein [Bryobacterales bacterium]